jgi:hypothetical protein
MRLGEMRLGRREGQPDTRLGIDRAQRRCVPGPSGAEEKTEARKDITIVAHDATLFE